MCFRLCVRDTLRLSVFPLASPLSSTASATALAALSGSFVSTTGLYDFPSPYIVGSRPWTFRSVRPLAEDTGSSGFRSRCLRACAGSQTARGPKASRDIDAPSFAFRLVQQRRHQGVATAGAMVVQFRGSI